MDRFSATVEAGRFVPDTAMRLPDGTRVVLDLVTSNGNEEGQTRPWPTSQEGIEQLIAEFEAMEPAVLTPDEETDIAKCRVALRPGKFGLDTPSIGGVRWML